MKYRIAHWYGTKPPVPEAIEVGQYATLYANGQPTGETVYEYEVEVEDLHEFAKKHGQIKLVPPGAGKGSNKEQWFIWVTRGNRWGQC